MNSNFEVQNTSMNGVKIITPFYAEDNRGYFLKSVEQDIFNQFGLDANIFEDFETYSEKDVIRGMHFQTQSPQTKYVRAIVGTIYDVIVDLREASMTYGKWISIELSDRNHLGLWIPAGFAHGFRVLSEGAVVSYKCIGKYLNNYDSGILWNDPDLAIDWMCDNPIISEKDSKLPGFEEFRSKYKHL